MRLAILVQRYGMDVNGGAEVLCREWASHLAARADIESVTVLTTCARDHETWANHYPAGTEVLDGVTVERFPVLFERLTALQNRLSALVMGTRWLPGFEPAWFVAQGPIAPGLLRRLVTAARTREFDAYLFVGYLYATTVFALPIVARRAVLAPTAHDERPIGLATFRALFRMPRAFAFLTPEERDFVHGRFHTRHKPCDVVGMGIDLVDDPQKEDSSLVPEDPYLLYVGRIESSKGFPRFYDELEAFRRACGDRVMRARDGRSYLGKDLKLVLAGRAAWGDVPKSDHLLALGFISEDQKRALLRRAEALVLPSRFESLSIVLLEAWAQRCPVLVDGHCQVTVGQVERSSGGASFRGADELTDVLCRMLQSPEQLREYGERGRAYVEANYTWPACMDRLANLLKLVAAS